MLNSFTRRVALLAVLGLAACGDGDNDPVPAPGTDPFAAVDAAARAAFVAEGIEGMGLAIYDRDGALIFERTYGSFSADRRVPIASASKLVSGVVLFRLVDQGLLNLDSTTGETLGWTGDKAAITLRHLLSFTSGLDPEHPCTYQADISLAECVDAIAQTELLAPPGERFDYGSTHLAVAGRMAEVVSGSAWNSLFGAQLRDALGLPQDIAYRANPLKSGGTDNPLLAGGLIMSMNEYARVLRFVFDKGRWQGGALMDPALFDLQTIAPYPNAVVGRSPGSRAVRYGLTAWLECETPETGCAAISSPGAFGFTPWLDRDAGYYAILGMDYSGSYRLHRGFGVYLEQQLKPLIADALAR